MFLPEGRFMRSVVCTALIALATPSQAAPPCANTLTALRALVLDPAFPLQWRETGIDDGKPLLLTLAERDGALHLRFAKSGEGLWAEGMVSVCGSGAALSARFDAGRMRFGEAAPWIIRYSHGTEFTLVRLGAAMRVAGTGWGSNFAAMP